MLVKQMKKKTRKMKGGGILDSIGSFFGTAKKKVGEVGETVSSDIRGVASNITGEVSTGLSDAQSSLGFNGGNKHGGKGRKHLTKKKRKHSVAKKSRKVHRNTKKIKVKKNVFIRQLNDINLI